MSGLDAFSDLRPLGSGGLGDVYVAVRRSTGTPVAIKVLRDWSDSSVSWQRAERELRALAELRGHPFVVQIEELVEVSGVPHLVMEYAPGGSVTDLLNERGGPLSVGEAVLIGEQTASALAASHRLGIIHLDIKPQNLLIGAFGQVKVCDFGIAALTRTERFRERTSAVSYRYASPEQLEDDGEVGPPADLFALGATLLHLLSGRPLPLRGDDATIARRVDEWVKPPGVTEHAARRIERLVARCLSPAPAARPTAVEVHEELEDIGASLGEARCRALQPATRIGAPVPGTAQSAVVPPPFARPPLDPPTIVRPMATVPVSAPPPPARRRAWMIGVAAVVLVLVGTAAALVVNRAGADDAAGTSTSATAASTTVATTVPVTTTLATSVVVDVSTTTPATSTTSTTSTTTSTTITTTTTTTAPPTTAPPATFASLATLATTPPPPAPPVTLRTDPPSAEVPALVPASLQEARDVFTQYLLDADGEREPVAWAVLSPCDQDQYDPDPATAFADFQRFWRNVVGHVETTGFDRGDDTYVDLGNGRTRLTTSLTYVTYIDRNGAGATTRNPPERVVLTFARLADGTLRIDDYAQPGATATTCDR